MFNVNKKDTRTTSLISACVLCSSVIDVVLVSYLLPNLNIFHTFFNAFTVEFEPINVCWDLDWIWNLLRAPQIGFRWKSVQKKFLYQSDMKSLDFRQGLACNILDWIKKYVYRWKTVFQKLRRPITYFSPISISLSPENLRKQKFFGMFSVGIEMEHWTKMGWRISKSGKTQCQKNHTAWRISSVNVTKSARNCGFDHVYWRNPFRKLHFFVQC